MFPTPPPAGEWRRGGMSTAPSSVSCGDAPAPALFLAFACGCDSGAEGECVVESRVMPGVLVVFALVTELAGIRLRAGGTSVGPATTATTAADTQEKHSGNSLPRNAWSSYTVIYNLQ